MSLVSRINDLATRVATEAKALRTLVNNNQTSLAALSFGTKSNLVTSLNELKTLIDNLSASAIEIDDAATSASTSKTWSASKISAQITAAISALTSGAPAALDTLDELSAALGDDANFAATITTALGNRLRFDAAQTLSSGQKTQGLANLGAAAVSHGHAAADVTSGTFAEARLPTISVAKGGTGATTAAGALTNLGAQAAADIGDPTTDFVAVFEAGLV